MRFYSFKQPLFCLQRALCALGAVFVVIVSAAAQAGTAGDVTTTDLKPSAQAPAAYKKPVTSSYPHSKQHEQKQKYAPKSSYGYKSTSKDDSYSKYPAEESPYAHYDTDSHYEPDSPHVKPTYPTKGDYKKDEYKGSYGSKPPSSYHHHDSYDDSYGGDSYGDEPPLTKQRGYGKYSVELIAAGPNQLSPGESLCFFNTCVGCVVGLPTLQLCTVTAWQRMLVGAVLA